MAKFQSTNGWIWFGIFLYVIQMIVFPYFLYNYLYKNIAGDEPESCSPSPGTDPDDDNSTKFFFDWINKCNIDLSSSNRDNIKLLFQVIIFVKFLIDLVVLYFISPINRDTQFSEYTKGKASSAGDFVKEGAKSAGTKVAEGATKSAGRAKSALLDKLEPPVE